MDKQEIIELNEKAIAMVVSPIAFNFRIGKSEKLKGKVFASCPVTSGFSYDLPPGSWSILGRPEEMTSEQCEKVMEGYEGSLYTLLKSKGLQDKSVIILIKQ